MSEDAEVQLESRETTTTSSNITNPKLISALKYLQEDSTNKAAFRNVLTALNQATLLVPIDLSEGQTSFVDSQDNSNRWDNHPINFHTITDTIGQHYLSAYTDEATIDAFAKHKSFSAMVFSAQDLWQFSLAMGIYHGVAINPKANTGSLLLDKCRLLSLMETLDEH